MDPMLREIPTSFETDRLVVRAPRPGDGVLVNAALVESIAELRTFMPWARETPTVDDTERVMRQGAAGWVLRTDLPLLLIRKEDGAIVGGSGLHAPSWTVPRFEIGYWGRTTLGRRGYVTEAVRGIARFAFDVLGARRVEIRMDGRNARSIAVAERSGFLLEGRLRKEQIAPDGALRDTLVYALTDDDRARLAAAP